jgi:alpha-glucosidase (family GH31 glycosyl hydrolase)
MFGSVDPGGLPVLEKGAPYKKKYICPKENGWIFYDRHTVYIPAEPWITVEAPLFTNFLCFIKKGSVIPTQTGNAILD